MTATATKRRPRNKPARFIGLLVAPSEVSRFGVVRIIVGHNETRYFIRSLPCDFPGSVAYELEKMDGPEEGETYHVRLSQDGRHCEEF